MTTGVILVSQTFWSSDIESRVTILPNYITLLLKNISFKKMRRMSSFCLFHLQLNCNFFKTLLQFATRSLELVRLKAFKLNRSYKQLIMGLVFQLLTIRFIFWHICDLYMTVSAVHNEIVLNYFSEVKLHGAHGKLKLNDL